MYKGTVIAGNDWAAPMREMEVPEARQGSIEAILHEASPDDRYILLNEASDLHYHSWTAHRAIGVVYHPAGEKTGNYVPSILSKRYDAFIYLDETRACTLYT